MNVVATKILKFWLKFRLIWKWTEEYRLQTKHVDNGMNLIGSEILKIKEMQYKKGTDDKGDLDYNKPQIFIDQLYKMRNVYDMETIRDEINTMIFAVSSFDAKAWNDLIPFYNFRDSKLYRTL